jgi:hypothetical protein
MHFDVQFEVPVGAVTPGGVYGAGLFARNVREFGLADSMP